MKPAVGPGERGRGRGHDGRPARPAGRGRAVAGPGRPRRCCGSSATRCRRSAPFFYDQTRTGAFTTESTNTFRYAAADARRWPRRSSRRPSGRRPQAATTPAGRRRGRAGSRRSEVANGRCPRRRPRAAAGRPTGRSAGAGDPPAPAGGPMGGRWAAAWRPRWPRRPEAMAGASGGRRGGERSARGRGATLAERSSGDEAGARRRRAAASTRSAVDGRARPCRRRRGRRVQPRERFVETAYWNPARRHRQGRQGARHLQGADGPVGVPLHGPRRHRRRHAGRPDDGRAWPSARTSSSTSRCPAIADPGGQAPVRRAGPPRRASRGRSSLRLTVYAGGREQVYPQDARR